MTDYYAHGSRRRVRVGKAKHGIFIESRDSLWGIFLEELGESSISTDDLLSLVENFIVFVPSDNGHWRIYYVDENERHQIKLCVAYLWPKYEAACRAAITLSGT